MTMSLQQSRRLLLILSLLLGTSTMVQSTPKTSQVASGRATEGLPNSKQRTLKKSGKAGGKSEGKRGSKGGIDGKMGGGKMGGGKMGGKGSDDYFYSAYPAFGYERHLGKGKGKDKNSGEQVQYLPQPSSPPGVFRCTVWGTTDTPIYPWCPQEPSGAPVTHSHSGNYYSTDANMEGYYHSHDGAGHYHNGAYGTNGRFGTDDFYDNGDNGNGFGGYGYGSNGGYGSGSNGGYGSGGSGYGYGGNGSGYGGNGYGGYNNDDGNGYVGYNNDDGNGYGGYNNDDGGNFPYDGVENILVDVSVDLDGNLDPTIGRIQGFLNSQVADDLAGTTAPGGITITHVDFFVSQDRNAASYCETCVNLDVLSHVYYSGTGSTAWLEGALLDAFLQHCAAITSIQGVGTALNPCHTLAVSPIYPIGFGGNDDDGGGAGGVLIGGAGAGAGAGGTGTGVGRGGAGIVESSTRSVESTGLGAGGAVGIAMAGLVLLALAALFVRRRRNRGKDHEELGDGQEDTFMLDARVTSQDEDSRFGMYPEGQTEGMVLGARSWNQDVHKCSSATCKLCEKQRAAGLQFVPTKGATTEDPLGL